jgi:hypothetical protein
MSEHTGTSNKEYNLVSVLYHALSGAEACDKYIHDSHDDAQLSEFLSETQQQYRAIAENAKHLLKRRI